MGFFSAMVFFAPLFVAVLSDDSLDTPDSPTCVLPNGDDGSDVPSDSLDTADSPTCVLPNGDDGSDGKDAPDAAVPSDTPDGDNPSGDSSSGDSPNVSCVTLNKDGGKDVLLVTVPCDSPNSNGDDGGDDGKYIGQAASNIQYGVMNPGGQPSSSASRPGQPYSGHGRVVGGKPVPPARGKGKN